MKITKHTVTSLAYELKVEGKLADKADEQQPLEYIHGTNMLIPRFEEELEGKEAGDDFDFTLSPEEAYGPYKMEYKFDIPKEAFMLNGELQEQFLQVGNIVPMRDDNGNVVRGIVAAIGEDKVTMDFNHPMAGKTLHFTGTVLAVREATEEELENGLHGEYLPQEECGHKCHHCHGDCGDEEEEKEDCCHGENRRNGTCDNHNGGLDKECSCGDDCDCGCNEGEECSCK